MAGLLSVLDTANLGRLTAYVQATTLVPGDDAGFSVKTVNALARSITLFAKAGAYKDAAEQCDTLVALYEGTRWHDTVAKRVATVKRHWHSHGALS